jgi:hypothetical protein
MGFFTISNDLPAMIFIYCSHGSIIADTPFFLEKGPAADATDAPQSWGWLCKPVMKMINFFRFSV